MRARPINALGGIAGRKLKIHFHNYNITSTDSGEVQSANACEDLTVDHKVFAVISISNAHWDSLRTCLAKSRTLLISDTALAFDDQDLRRLSTFYPIDAMSIDRKITALIDALAAQGYFAPWDIRRAAPAPGGTTKIGLISFDEPVYNRHIPQFEAELARHGQKIAEKARVRLDNNGVTTFEFPAIVQQNVPDDKVLHGLQGIGWAPFTDVQSPPPLGATREACLKMFADKDIEATTANAVSVLLTQCDYFFFFQRVASAAGRVLNEQTFHAAASGLGGNQFSYLSFAHNFDRHRDCIRFTRFGVAAP